MLFNSYAFLFGFLPVTLGVFFLLGKWSEKAAASFLVLASLFFYGWWDPRYLGLLLLSIVFNYASGLAIARAIADGRERRRKTVFTAAVAANLALLGYYKYAHFFLTSLHSVAGTRIGVADIVLPLGISFFTFTQIAYLVDTYRGQVKEARFIHYVLFVTYFPHLIAGPVLHHKEMMPQFAKSETYRVDFENLSVGATIFVMGLGKKVLFADNVAHYASPTFSLATTGQHVYFVEAWVAVLAYAAQLYFDFSGYSDMAIGLSRMFGIRLPLNFASPYKSTNIIEFWRRWHVTLSRFLRDYLYIPMGGNRHGMFARYRNLFMTMLLGGLWHGAGWTYVIFGAIQGSYLIVNHGWHALRERFGIPYDPEKSSRLGRIVGTLITFFFILQSWVVFRSDSIDAAYAMLRAMWGRNGLHIGDTNDALEAMAWIIPLLGIAFFMPNTQQIMARFEPALDTKRFPEDLPARKPWRPHWVWAVAIALVAVASVMTTSNKSEFLYFQF